MWKEWKNRANGSIFQSVILSEAKNLMNYYVYILTNPNNKVLYTGITNNLNRRIFEHKNKLVEGFTKKYNVTKMVFYDIFSSPQEAIAAEKKIKGWLRKKKIDLIKSKNPDFQDLSLEIE